jgi:putative ABC transport system ATP-binding protein
VLELRELSKHYPVGDGEPVRAVDGVSLKVAAGELVALYGPSGSGKTTLLMLVAALLVPDSGAVIVDGREISALSDDDRARYRLRELGYVDQAFDLLPGGTVVQNAAMKLWLTEGARRAERTVEPLLERLGLGERLGHRPDELSMGERQRVMIARALSTKPKLVLADEPTGSLDTRHGGEVLGLLSEICRERGAAVLLVTHDPQATRFADRVLALRDGRLVGFEPDDVFAPLSGR